MSSDFVPKFKCDFLLQQSIKSLVNIVYCNIVYFKRNIVCLLSFACKILPIKPHQNCCVSLSSTAVISF